MEQNLTGTIINGYKIGDLLGKGGMGEVYKAIPPDDDTPVAIKLLREDYADDVKFQQRFIREIRILGALKHENIVKIYKNGLIDNRQLFFTMELISGLPLSIMMEQRQFSPLAYWEVLSQVAAGLAFAHENKVIHRDIKPANIFIEPRDNRLYVVLADFGLGKQEGIDRTMTEMGTSLGTPLYMAPETIMGQSPSELSDIFAVAVITYGILLGRPIFNHKYPHQIAMAHITDEIDRPSDLHGDFPLCLEDVIMKGLEKKPQDRYQSIEAFADAYLECMQSLTHTERTKIYHVETP